MNGQDPTKKPPQTSEDFYKQLLDAPEGVGEGGARAGAGAGQRAPDAGQGTASPGSAVSSPEFYASLLKDEAPAPATPPPSPSLADAMRESAQQIESGGAPGMGMIGMGIGLESRLAQSVLERPPADHPPELTEGPGPIEERARELLGFGKSFLEHPIMSLYDMFVQPFVKGAQHPPMSPTLAALASFSPDADVRRAASGTYDIVDARRQAIALVASSFVGGEAFKILRGLPGARAGAISGAIGGAVYPLAAEPPGEDRAEMLSKVGMFTLMALAPGLVMKHAAQTVGPGTEGMATIPDLTADVTARVRAEAWKNVKEAWPTQPNDEPPAAPRPNESLVQMPGTEKGFEVFGPRATPPVPTAPTITEIQDRLGGRAAVMADQAEKQKTGKVVANISTPEALYWDAQEAAEKAKALEQTSFNPQAAIAALEAKDRAVKGTIMSNDDALMGFRSFSESVDNYPEQMIDMPDVRDIQNKYPIEFDRAIKQRDPVGAMASFVDGMSKYVEDRTISPELAESIGGRMEQYLATRLRNELYNSFDARFRYWFQQNKLPPSQFDGLWEQAALMQARELREGFGDEDIATHDEMAAAMIKAREHLDQFVATMDDASRFGYDLDTTPSGKYVLRDSDSKEILHTGELDEVREFINNGGNARGVSLDGGGRNNQVPPSAIGGDQMPPPNEPPKMRADDELIAPYPTSRGLMEKLLTAERLAMAKWTTPRQSVFAAWDSRFGTNFTSDVFIPTQNARRTMNANIHPWIERIADDVGSHLDGLSPDRRRLVFRAVETMTPDEIITRGYSRPLNDAEVNTAKAIAGMKPDLWKVFDYMRERATLQNTLQGSKLQNALQVLDQRHGLDDMHRNVVRIFEGVLSQDVNDMSLGMIVRLSDAIMNDAPSRKQFMAQNQFTPAMRQAVENIDRFGQDIAPLFGIDPVQMIKGYMPHYRVFDGGKARGQGYLFQKGMDATPMGKFISQMARTGELDVFEQDPVKSLVRYVRAGMASKDFSPAFNDAMQAASVELAKLPPGSQKTAKRFIEDYFTEIRGRPDASVSFVQDAAGEVMNMLKLGDTSLRRDFIDTMASLTYAGTIGLRPSVMWKHVNQMLFLGYSRFGSEGLANALRKIPGPGDWDRIRERRMDGTLPTLGPSWLEAPEEKGLMEGYIGKLDGWARKAAEVGMTYNGLKSVYELSHYIWYESKRAQALELGNQYMKGEISREAAYDKMFINSYDPGFIRMFDDLFRNIRKQPENVEKAAHLLGQQTGKEITFEYGNANHPEFLGSNFGRLVGMFGNWSTWMTDYVGRMLSRGTLAERARFVARFAAVNGAIWAGGRAMGLSTMGWYLMPHINYLTTSLANLPVMNLKNWIPYGNAYNDWKDALTNDQIQDFLHFFARLNGIRPSEE